MTAEYGRRAWAGYIEFDINVDCPYPGLLWALRPCKPASLTQRMRRVAGMSSPDAGAPDRLRAEVVRRAPESQTEPYDDRHLSALEGMVSAAAKCVSADVPQSDGGAATRGFGRPASGSQLPPPPARRASLRTRPHGRHDPSRVRRAAGQEGAPPSRQLESSSPELANPGRSRRPDWRPSP
jgi:hypothetical protein